MKTASPALPHVTRPGPSTMTTIRRFLRGMVVTRAQRRALRALEPHQRKDIGVTEHDIRAELDRSVWDIPDWWR